MPDERTSELIRQLTLRKLQFARELLREHKLASYGTRDRLNDRIGKAVNEGIIPPEEIELLLDELDAWGNQRVLLGVLPRRFLELYRDEAAVRERIREADLDTELLGREEVALIPPEQLTPMGVQLLDDGSQRTLRLLAAKIRVVDTPLRDHSEIPATELSAELPAGLAVDRSEGIVYKPFRRERQKAISFAEIDLDTGVSLISTTLLRHGVNYTGEFSEMFELFERLLPLGAMEFLPLYNAVREIRRLSHDEVLIYSRRSRTAVGGTMELRSHSSAADIRQDELLENAATALDTAEGAHCNCRWRPAAGLAEEVHTHIFSPKGEVSVLGQVTEGSVRYVLQRIRELN